MSMILRGNQQIFREGIANLPLIVGHRGHMKEVENSLLAFQKAIDSKLPMIELDIWLTKDDHPLVIHCSSDFKIDTAKGITGFVKDYTFEETRKYFLDKNQVIPSLDETLQLCKGKTLVIIEIKEIEKKDLIVDKVIELLKKYDMLNQVIISSFDLEYYDIIRKKNCDLEFAGNAETIDEVRVILNRQDLVNFSLVMDSRALTKDFIDMVHLRSIGVGLYFYPDPLHSDELMNKFFEMGVDLFIIDDPDMGIKQRSSYFKI